MECIVQLHSLSLTLSIAIKYNVHIIYVFKYTRTYIYSGQCILNLINTDNCDPLLPFVIFIVLVSVSGIETSFVNDLMAWFLITQVSTKIISLNG